VADLLGVETSNGVGRANAPDTSTQRSGRRPTMSDTEPGAHWRQNGSPMLVVERWDCDMIAVV
jgi:hypothetical protein